MPESEFLYLDATAWTALGTLTALGIAVGGLVWLWLKHIRLAPKLSLDLTHALSFSTVVDDALWMRIPVKNALGKMTAKDVEVYLESVAELSASGKKGMDGFIPMRLSWSHTGSSVCERIPGGTYRLLDLGVHFPKGKVVAGINELVITDPPVFQFGGEVAGHAPKALSLGTLEVSVIISNDKSSPRRQIFKIVFLKGTSGPSLKVEET